MSIFDFFGKKKEEKHYNATNIKVHDLELNYLLDYELETWQVSKMYEYDWGNNFFTREFQLKKGREKIFLAIEEDDDLELTISKKNSN